MRTTVALDDELLAASARGTGLKGEICAGPQCAPCLDQARKRQSVIFAGRFGAWFEARRPPRDAA